MKYKGILKTTAFLLALLSVVFCLNQWYSLPRTYQSNTLKAFEDEDKNTVDGIFVGTSVVAHAWVAPAAYNETGMTMYQIATNVQPFGATTAIMDYARKNQDVKYAVVDIHGLRQSAIMDSCTPGRIRTLYCNIFDSSASRKIKNASLDFARRAYEFYGEPEGSKKIDFDDLSYKISFLNFHSRWSEGLTETDFVLPDNQFKGAVDMYKHCFLIKDCTDLVEPWSEEAIEPDEFQKNELKMLFEYFDSNNIKVLFVNVPSCRDSQSQRELKGIIEYCQQSGYDAIDFCSEEMLEKTGISLEKDFLDEGHLNSSGAVKFSEYLARYLVENEYGVTDHRGDEKYASWDEATEKYQEFYEKGWKKAESDK